MKTRKYAVFGILLFSSVLFVGGVGNFITGNAVMGSTTIELGFGESVNVYGKEISVKKLSVSSLEGGRTLTKRGDFLAVLEVSGLRGYVKLLETETINQLKIKFLDVEDPLSDKFKIKLLVSRNPASGPDSGLIDYPYPFVRNGMYDSCVVISDDYSEYEWNSAMKIAASLKQHRRSMPLILPESQSENCGRSKILVGKPCEIKLMSSYIKDDSCDAGLNKGEGLIRYFSVSYRPDTAYLVVTGHSNEDIMKAATVLAHQTDFYGAESNEVLVYGDLLNDYSLKVKELGTVVQANPRGKVKQALVYDRNKL